MKNEMLVLIAIVAFVTTAPSIADNIKNTEQSTDVPYDVKKPGDPHDERQECQKWCSVRERCCTKYLLDGKCKLWTTKTVRYCCGSEQSPPAVNPC